MFGSKKRRRERLRAQPFPAHWREILRRDVPYHERLAPDQQQELQGDIQVFVAEKNFEGCGGLEMTDDIKVTIAAYACLLLLGRPHDFYPRLDSILVYPTAFRVPTTRSGPSNTIIEDVETRLGESWETGAVVLAWDEMLQPPGDDSPRHNVVLHEFAHQLDQENGAIDGAPRLDQSVESAGWVRTWRREYRALRADMRAGRPTVLDEYGATAPAEFFAVATECFFENPLPLQARHPSLYAELERFYRQDPARLLSAGS